MTATTGPAGGFSLSPSDWPTARTLGQKVAWVNISVSRTAKKPRPEARQSDREENTRAEKEDMRPGKFTLAEKS